MEENLYIMSGGTVPAEFNRFLYMKTAEYKNGVKNPCLRKYSNGEISNIIGQIGTDNNAVAFTEKPVALIMPQASYEGKRQVNAFYRDYKKAGFKPSSILFKNGEMNDEEILKRINNASLIYISGGRLDILLESFKSKGIDKILKSLKGKIIVGISAGASCLFEYAVSDCNMEESSKYTLIKGLGLIKGIYCPHAEEEKREEALKNKDLIFKDADKSIFDKLSLTKNISEEVIII